jgi:predicted permease
MHWLTQLFTRSRQYDELSATIREHLEEKIADLIERGLAREEAERTARREFGNAKLIEERSREVWQWPAIESVYADVKFALRQLLRSPGFAVVSLLTVALGIGATTAVFSVIDAVILRPLPYSQPALLVDADATARNNISSARNSLSYPDFFDWRTQNKTLEHLVSYHDRSYTLTGLGRPLHVDAEVTSWDLVPTLGVTPEIGRGFTLNEEKPGSNVFLISHELWASHFDSDRSMIGRVIHLNGDSFTVVGVMPPTFRFPVTEPQTSIWTTLSVDSGPNEQNVPTQDRNNHFLNAIGRMKPGFTVAQVSEDLDTIANNLAKRYPNSNTLCNAAKAQPELNSLLGGVRTELMVVQGAVILILLISCGNIANLLLARIRERQREIAMRSALGAGRWRIVRQLIIESLVLSTVGGIAGIGLALACTPLMLSLIGDNIPRAANAGVNPHVLAFSTLVSLAVGLIFGIIPAITTSKENLIASLRGGDRSGTSSHDGVRSFLIVGQVALGMVVITAAGLLGTSFMNLTRANQGFSPDHILTFFFDLPDSRYKDIRQNFYPSCAENPAVQGGDVERGERSSPKLNSVSAAARCTGG